MASLDKGKRKITLGILAHVDAGKTTLAEAMLYICGHLRTLGRVDHQDCFLDTNTMERQRGITIFSKQARMSWKDLEITLLDTPGHVDFSAEMERTLQVLDMAVLVVSGADGIQGHTETLLRLLERYRIPTVLFVNKMDQTGTDMNRLEETLRGKLGSALLNLCAPDTSFRELLSGDANPSEWPEDACELAACTHEKLLEQYLETGVIEKEMLQEAVTERRLFPCLFGAALKLEGVEALLDTISYFYEEPQYPAEFGARVFKISRDEAGNRLTMMKITGGTLKAKQLLEGSKAFKSQTSGSAATGGEDTDGAEEDSRWQAKADQLRLYDGVKYAPTDEADAGTIVAVTGLSDTYAGEGLGTEYEDEVPILEPVLVYRLELPLEVDAVQAFGKLRMLEEEDPQLHLLWKARHKEIHVQVMGEIQTQILGEMIKERFGWAVSFGEGSIVHKETIAAPSYGIGHFEPLRHYAEVQVLIEPGERGSGIQFVSLCSEDILDKNWQRLIRTHVEETIHPGVLTGSEATDLRVILMTGRAHPKHTEGGDFRQATYRAIRNALRQAENVLLEPVFSFSMILPSEYLGRAMTDLERKFAHMNPPELLGDTAQLTGTVPVSLFQGYLREMLAYTGGRGQMTCAVAGYAPCHNAQEVADSYAYDPEADLRRPTGSVFCAHGAGFQVPWDQVAEYAHLECPMNLEQFLSEYALQEGSKNASEAIENLKKAVAVVQTAENTPKPLSGAKVRSASGVITQEEIDAIFARSQANKSDHNARYKMYHRGHDRNSGSKTVYAGDTKATSSGKTPPPKEKYFLVDGYNIIFAWEELRSLSERSIDGARDRLVDICCDYQGMIGGTLILVFDAYKVSGGTGSIQKWNNIYVVYTKEAETADAYIEKTTHQLSGKAQVTVATSDRLEQMIIWGNGALRMSAGEFLEAVENGRKRLRETVLDKDTTLKNYLLGGDEN